MAKRLYTVKGGDTLSIIARDVLGNMQRWPEIAFINEIEPPYLIKTGQVILLPNDGEPLEVVIPYTRPAAATQKQSADLLTPATLAAIVVAAFLLMR